MMVEKEDLGLSLSLSFPHEKRTATLITTTGGSGCNNPVQLNLMPSLSVTVTADPSPFAHLLHHKTSWTTTHQTFPSSSSGLFCFVLFFWKIRSNVCFIWEF